MGYHGGIMEIQYHGSMKMDTSWNDPSLDIFGVPTVTCPGAKAHVFHAGLYTRVLSEAKMQMVRSRWTVDVVRSGWDQILDLQNPFKLLIFSLLDRIVYIWSYVHIYIYMLWFVLVGAVGWRRIKPYCNSGGKTAENWQLLRSNADSSPLFKFSPDSAVVKVVRHFYFEATVPADVLCMDHGWIMLELRYPLVRVIEYSGGQITHWIMCRELRCWMASVRSFPRLC